MSSSHLPSRAPALGTVVGGRFELRRFLGVGGVGAVYEASTAQGERVAVKLLLALAQAEHADLVARFEREAGISSLVHDPHVVPVLGKGTDAALRIPYLVMPLLIGCDLGELLERAAPLHPTVAVRIACQACRALEAAHAAGVVHRDVKPANLFLDHDPSGDVTVRVLDFGLAKLLDEEGLTRSGTFLGTPHFMAPEQVLDAKRVDARADVWGLGATLYAALTGALPFASATSTAELLLAIAHEVVTPLQDHAPWIDPALARIVHGTLVRDRERRCPSAAALLDALAGFCAGDERVHETMLDAFPAELREQKAERVAVPVAWSGLPTATGEPPTVREGQRDPLLGVTLAGRFTLLHRLGRGGMGAVYEAEGTGGERFAVKVMTRDVADSIHRARFVREARAAMRIKSEHVVRVHEVGDEPPFLVMDLLEGADLSRLIARRGALAPAPVARLFVQACTGLAAAHALGIVHRDVKPSNLFLRYLPNGVLQLQICDFGIAKELDDSGGRTSSLTRTGGVIGSPQYMSPEQTKDAKHVDARSDIWSLGVSLYEALSAETPWVGRTTVGELIVAICTEPIAHLQDRAPWVPTALAEAVHRCLARSPEQRFATMAELAAALEPFASSAERTTLAALSLSPSSRARLAPRAAGTPTLDTRTAVVATTRATTTAPGPRGLVAAVAIAAIGALAAWIAWPRAPVAPGAALEPIATRSEPTQALASAPLATSATAPPSAPLLATVEPRPLLARPMPSLHAAPSATVSARPAASIERPAADDQWR